MNKEEKLKLINKALESSKNAYAPYSNFHVGAAAVDDNNNYYLGCNVENASFGLTCCAERIALFKSVTEKASKIKAIAIISPDNEGVLTPCGACRQVINELAPDATIILADKELNFIEKTVQELLPGAFILKK